MLLFFEVFLLSLRRYYEKYFGKFMMKDELCFIDKKNEEQKIKESFQFNLKNATVNK